MPRTFGRGQWIAFAVVACAVLSSLVGFSGAATAHPGHPLRSPTNVGPWDPLIGDPGTSVPRYHVSTAQLPEGPRPAQWPYNPAWLAYDSADSSFWVASGAGTVDQILAANASSVNNSLAVGSQPFGVAVDPYAHEVFVTNELTDNVTVISDLTLKPIASIPVGANPTGVAACGQWVSVANEGSNNVSEISATSLTVNATIAVGSEPVGVACDSLTGEVFVANSGSYSLSVIDPANASVLATIPVGADPVGVAVDNRSETVWVTNAGSQNVSVINISTWDVVANVPILNADWLTIDLSGLAYDWQTDQVWVGGGFYYLIVLNGSAETVSNVYSTDPSGVAYDPASGQVCTTNVYNQTFQCFTGASSAVATTPITFDEVGLSNGTVWTVAEAGGPSLHSGTTSITFYAGPWFVAVFGYDYTFVIPPVGGEAPGSATLAVPASNKPIVVNVTFSSSATVGTADFNETGLPPNAGWSVDAGGLLLEGEARDLTAPAVAGTMAFEVQTVAGGTPTPSSGNLSVTTGSSIQDIAFSTTLSPVTFDESGLPAGTTWFVNFTSGPALNQSGALIGSSWTVWLPNGTFTYSAVTPDPAFDSPGTSTLVVFGTPPQPISVVFPLVAFAYHFTESGLPALTTWSVKVNGSIASAALATIQVYLPAGAYNYVVEQIRGYQSSPLNGSIFVATTGSNSVAIEFTSTWTYNLTFGEAGLPAGAGWSVGIGAQFESSVTSSITFVEPNGTYGYVVGTVAGYVAPSSGVVNLSGHDDSVTIRFSPQTFPVIVVEFGLPNGTNWSVTVTDAASGYNVTHWSDTSAIVFDLPNGTYAVEVSVPTGYSANISGAQFTVDGAGANGPSIHYSNGPTTPGGRSETTASGVPIEYWLALGALVVVTGVFAVGWLTARRRSSPPGPTIPQK